MNKEKISPMKLLLPERPARRVHFEFMNSNRASARTKKQARDFEMNITNKELDQNKAKIENEPVPLKCREVLKKTMTRKQLRMHNQQAILFGKDLLLVQI